jgi:hypothetical protein
MSAAIRAVKLPGVKLSARVENQLEVRGCGQGGEIDADAVAASESDVKLVRREQPVDEV